MNNQSFSARVALTAGLLLVGACGVSPAYVGANARTIRTNAEATAKTLAGVPCDQEGNCTVKQGVVQMMSSDMKQITERANAMCAIAEPNCDGKESK